MKTKQKMVEGRQWIADAPVIIVACADPSASGIKGDQHYYMLDVGIAMVHIVLAAAERNLGTCWIGWFKEDVVRSALGISDDLRIVARTAAWGEAGLWQLAEFMVRAGIGDVMEDSGVGREADLSVEVVSQRQEVMRLLDPDGMGSDLKMFVQACGSMLDIARSVLQPGR